MASARHDDMPCGRCPCGVYALGAVLEGVEMFRGVQTQRDALELAPRCKADASHICFGTRDFIIACDFPMDEARCASIIAEVTA